jgi:plasmid stabilization system protein ParE
VSARYVVLPKADKDLDDEAYYLVDEAGLEAGLSFLPAARETFALLAGHPGMGWKCRLEHRSLASARVFRVTRFERILVFYRPCSTGIEVMRVLHSSQDLEELFAKEGAPD